MSEPPVKVDAGRKKKLAKKSAKGEIASVDNYYECQTMGIMGIPHLSLIKDNTRVNSKHDLNLSELRDLIIALMMDKLTPKYFLIKNKPFIRQIVVLHISYSTGDDSFLSEFGLGDATAVRVSRNNNELCFLPQKLLTLPISSCSVESLLAASSNSELPEFGTASASDKAAAGVYSVLNRYVLSPSLLRLWDFPVAQSAPVAVISANDTSEKVVVAAALVSGIVTSELDADISISADEQPANKRQRVEENYTSVVAAAVAVANDSMEIVEDNNTDNCTDNAATETDTVVGVSDVVASENATTTTIAVTDMVSDDALAESTAVEGLYYGSLPTPQEAQQVLSHPLFQSLRCAVVGSAHTYIHTVSRDSAQYQVIGSIGATTTSTATAVPVFDKYSIAANSSNNSRNNTVLNNVTKGLSIAAIDCEMCETKLGLEVTRVTVVDMHSAVVLDCLVKPTNPILHYRTQYSGITASMLANVTTTLAQVQVALLRLLPTECILVGHSLENDLKYLRLVHNRCVDTSVLYPHPKGYPLRLKLKVLAEDYLQLRIQTGSSAGHDSVEDARAAMRLALLKAECGPLFGIKNTDETRVALCGQFNTASTMSYLAWETTSERIPDNNSSDNNSSKSSGGLASSASTNSLASTYDNSSGFNYSSGDVPSGKKASTHNYLLQSCIGGNAVVRETYSASETITTACEFIAARKINNNGGAYDSTTDKMTLIVASIRHGSEHDTAQLSTYVQQLRAAVQESGRRGLLVVTAQPALETAQALRTRRRVCTTNSMSTMVWDTEQEQQLQQEVTRCSLGKAVFGVV